MRPRRSSFHQLNFPLKRKLGRKVAKPNGSDNFPKSKCETEKNCDNQITEITTIWLPAYTTSEANKQAFWLCGKWKFPNNSLLDWGKKFFIREKRNKLWRGCFVDVCLISFLTCCYNPHDFSSHFSAFFNKKSIKQVFHSALLAFWFFPAALSASPETHYIDMSFSQYINLPYFFASLRLPAIASLDGCFWGWKHS